MTKLSDNLFQLRKLHNLTQEQVAAELGVSRQAVAKWETGETTPDLSNCLALALFAYYLSSILHLMPYHRILIIQLVVRTLFIMSLHQARSIILVHIHFAVIFLIIFIVYIVYTTVTARHNILQFLLPYFPYPVCCLSFTSDSSAEHYLHVEITSS